MLYEHSLALPAVNLAVSLMVAYFYSEQVERTNITIWLGLVVIATIARFGSWYAYQVRAPAKEDAWKWGYGFVLVMALTGSAWGATSYLMFVPDSIPFQLAIASTAVAVVSVAVTAQSSYLRAQFVFVILSLGPYVVVYFSQGTEFHRFIGALLAVYIVVGMIVSRGLHRILEELIVLRFNLVEQKEVAEQANIAKSKFLAAASHDLRQPLHALAIFAASLAHHARDPETAHMVKNINSSVTALEGLFNALLDISKLDAKIIEPDLKGFRLAALFERLANDYAQQARAKGLDWRSDATDAVVRSDPVLLETILRNLISNAIHYSSHGTVTLRCRTAADRVYIDVIDTGIGIPQAQQKEIFREFHQLHNPERDRDKGLGLGLAIVERLAGLLEHGIEVVSEPGRGSTFTVVVPLGVLEEPTAGSADEVTAEPVDRLPPLSVLVIDDEPSILEAMQSLLSTWGHAVLVASSQDEALSRLGDYPGRPDAMIVDYRLRDGRTGVEAIAAIEKALGEPVPALIITGDTAPERLREAKASGYTLLHKPVAPARLRAFLRRIQTDKGAVQRRA